MSLKEKLFNLKEELLSYNPISRDHEFDAELKDHPIPDSNIYRLFYIDYHRYGEGYGMGPNNVGMIHYACQAFKFPDGMSREDGFKVLSYLTDFIEKRDGIDECSLKSVRTLDSVLDLERFGFKRVDSAVCGPVINLYTVAGRILLFKRSEYYKDYFNWYTEGITRDEIEKIYMKLGIEFRDIVWLDNVDKPKQYEKK